MQIHKFDLNLEVSLINFFWNFNLRDESEIWIIETYTKLIFNQIHKETKKINTEQMHFNIAMLQAFRAHFPS